MIDADIVAVLIAFIFAYLYATEKQFILKYVFLFISIMIMIFASTQNYALTQNVANYTYSGNTLISITTNYTYAATNYNIPLVYGIGTLLIALVAYFVFMLIKSARKVI